MPMVSYLPTVLLSIYFIIPMIIGVQACLIKFLFKKSLPTGQTKQALWPQAIHLLRKLSIRISPVVPKKIFRNPALQENLMHSMVFSLTAFLTYVGAHTMQQ